MKRQLLKAALRLPMRLVVVWALGFFAASEGYAGDAPTPVGFGVTVQPVDQTVQAAGAELVASVTLTGSGTDPDGDPLTFATPPGIWTGTATWMPTMSCRSRCDRA